MKLQPASRREVARIAAGSGVCAVLEISGLFLLSLLGVGTFSYKVILGALGGSVIAVINFAMMCLMVQSAAATDDQKLRRAKVQASYHFRMILQAAWLIFAFFVPFLSVIAAAIPLFFPSAIIFFLQATGRLVSPSDNTAPRQDIPAEDEEDEPGPFEV